MNRMIFAGPAALLFTVLSCGLVKAQDVGPRVGGVPSTPTVSPYLNLLRNGNSATLNYYGLVRPQFQTNAGIQGLRQQFALSRSGPLPGTESLDDQLITGHAAVFMNLGGYFQSATGALRSTRVSPPASSRTAGGAAAPQLPRPGPR